MRGKEDNAMKVIINNGGNVSEERDRGRGQEKFREEIA